MRRDRLTAEPIGETMTIGALSRRTGVPVKRLRRYEDLGFIYTVGRSVGNYRMFDECAVWCIGAVETWRALGLTLAEIGVLTEHYLAEPQDNIGPVLAERLHAARCRTVERIGELQQRVARIDAFAADHRAELAGDADFRHTDPRFTHRD